MWIAIFLSTVPAQGVGETLTEVTEFLFWLHCGHARVLRCEGVVFQIPFLFSVVSDLCWSLTKKKSEKADSRQHWAVFGSALLGPSLEIMLQWRIVICRNTFCFMAVCFFSWFFLSATERDYVQPVDVPNFGEKKFSGHRNSPWSFIDLGYFLFVVVFCKISFLSPKLKTGWNSSRQRKNCLFSLQWIVGRKMKLIEFVTSNHRIRQRHLPSRRAKASARFFDGNQATSPESPPGAKLSIQSFVRVFFSNSAETLTGTPWLGAVAGPVFCRMQGTQLALQAN